MHRWFANVCNDNVISNQSCRLALGEEEKVGYSHPYQMTMLKERKKGYRTKKEEGEKKKFGLSCD